ncbi:GNAT family N-acetyltransferase [Pseudomonas sp. MPDS]|uniref:GNAT family N-acetyltransferase n=1 Tax=Pseudomonas sp. MPDS TaxID=2762896 RepID=UPI0015639660|nr:GNAT family N-acetyltransferase [Pseudomonas sp. MPDS]QKJ37280.1 GNAT family N-acetyltransferase [Pseudomonas sp. MPDS]
MLQIRPAKQGDAQVAFDIRVQAIRHQCIAAYTNDQVMAWTSVPFTDGYRAWVEKDYHLASVDGVPVGTGLIDFQSGELGAVFVLPQFMGQGIGKRMVSYLEHLAREGGLAEIHLEATLNAAAFYRRCGFTAGAQSVYNSPSGLQLACIPMRKQLIDPGAYDLAGVNSIEADTQAGG